MAFGALPSSIDPDDAFDPSWAEPVDDGLTEWPASDLEYLVYFNPDHRPALDREEVERQLLAEIAPRYRIVWFEDLTPEALQLWSPFATRRAEDTFLAEGYARGSVPGMDVLPGPEVLRRRYDHQAHHRAHAQSVAMMRCLAYVTRSTIISVRALVPRGQRPAWLRHTVNQILTPVCGRLDAVVDDGLRVPELPLLTRDGILLACNNFNIRQIVHPSIPTTPGTIDRIGRRDILTWCGHDHEIVNEQVRRELRNPAQYFGYDFDLCAAALWLCQSVMELRVSLAEIHRRLQVNNPVFGNAAQVEDYENTSMCVRFRDIYGENNPNYQEPTIQPAVSTLRRRLLTAFHGGMRLPFEAGYEHEYGALENLARWIGCLRRTGCAVLDWDLARDIVDIADENLLDLHHLLATTEGAEGAELIVDLLPAAGWEALFAAIELIQDGRHKSFTVSYAFPCMDNPNVGARMLPDNAHIAIVGPFLMLPLRQAHLWRDRAHQIPRAGLYLPVPA